MIEPTFDMGIMQPKPQIERMLKLLQFQYKKYFC